MAVEIYNVFFSSMQFDNSLVPQVRQQMIKVKQCFLISKWMLVTIRRIRGDCNDIDTN